MSSIIKDSIGLATHAIRRNKLRALLSVLGTAIGIASIIVIMSAGESLRLILVSELESFGTDYIQIEIKVPNTSQTSTDNAGGLAQGVSVTTLDLHDKKDIDNIPNVRYSYGAVLGQGSATTIYEEKVLNYFAVTHEFDAIDPAEIAEGRFFTEEEDQGLARAVVLGADAAAEFFPNQSPIGETIRIQKQRFRVVGVYEERGSTGFIDFDGYAYIPLRTAQQLLLGFDHLTFISAQLIDTSLDDATAEEITSILRINHDITDPNKDDFAVTTQAEANEIIGTILTGVTLVLTIIASIALLVGGVGIMNIMYVAVSERIFEIGLRKSVGATGVRIRTQFLVEAVVITFFGGITGLLLALLMLLAMYFVAPYAGFTWPFAISINSIILGIVFSSLVGLFFGYFPAKKAAELRPIEALSHSN